MANVTRTMTGAGFARLCGVDAATVTHWCKGGMPHNGGGASGVKLEIDIKTAIPWVVRNRTEKPGSERERLAKEQADKVAIENAKSRGELLMSPHVEDAIAAALATLAAQLDGLAGRMATPLASIDDPATIRASLMDETRRIRTAYAEQLSELADIAGDPEADQPDSPAPAKKDGERVG